MFVCFSFLELPCFSFWFPCLPFYCKFHYTCFPTALHCLKSASVGIHALGFLSFELKLTNHRLECRKVSILELHLQEVAVREKETGSGCNMETSKKLLRHYDCDKKQWFEKCLVLRSLHALSSGFLQSFKKHSKL